MDRCGTRDTEWFGLGCGLAWQAGSARRNGGLCRSLRRGAGVAMIPAELVTTAVMLLAHVWIWRQIFTRSDRLAVLISAALSMLSPWWGTQETIRATPWMPGGFRAAATAVGTLWAFIVCAAVLMVMVRRTLRL